ncbi:hypothetical protein Q9966_015320 [Columba livia]|nr:hypothetical protein Q9966_015320 [Columba livia]
MHGAILARGDVMRWDMRCAGCVARGGCNARGCDAPGAMRGCALRGVRCAGLCCRPAEVACLSGAQRRPLPVYPPHAPLPFQPFLGGVRRGERFVQGAQGWNGGCGTKVSVWTAALENEDEQGVCARCPSPWPWAPLNRVCSILTPPCRTDHRSHPSQLLFSAQQPQLSQCLLSTKMLQTRKQKCHQQHLPFLAHPHQRNVSDFCQGLCLKTPLHGDTTRPKAPTVCQALLQPHLAARSLQNQKPHNLVFQALGTDHGLSEPSETDMSSHCPCSRTGKGHPVGGCKSWSEEQYLPELHHQGPELDNNLERGLGRRIVLHRSIQPRGSQ